MASIPVQRPKGTPTMLGSIEEKHVTFVVDTSGSMYSFLPVVKEHLVEALLTRSFKEKDTMFNIVTFSSTVAPWADKMVKCTPQTVMIAGDWLRKVECSTGTNALDALIVAFADPICEGLYLITDGLPDQDQDTILREVAKVGQGRPVHCIYLVGSTADTPAHEFLESLAVQTAGTFYLISLTQHGDIERVTAVVRADHAGVREPNPVYITNVPVATGDGADHLEGTKRDTKPEVHPGQSERHHQVGNTTDRERPVKLCSVRTSMDHNPLADSAETMAFTRPAKVVQYPGMAWESYRPPRLVKRLVTHASPLAADKGLVQGMRVLAKRDRDGYYCPGTLTEEINPQRTVLITFDRDPKGPKLQHLLQETGLYDVIAYNEAMRHTITPGDKVLAPWEREGYRMAPGTVIEGIEGRSSGCAADTSRLIVNLFNGKTEKVPKQKAIWIPTALYERIKLEIQMPLTARQFLINDPNYPSVPASYHPNLKSYTEYEMISSLGNRRDVPDDHFGEGGPVYSVRRLNRSAVMGDEINTLIPGTNMTKDQLHHKVMRQLAENSMYSLPAMSGETRYRRYLQKDTNMADKREDDENGFQGVDPIEEDSMEDSGVSLEKLEPGEVDDRSDSGCEEDKFVDTGMQTLSLVDSGSMTDSSLLFSPKKDKKRSKDQPMWRYWKRTPQPKTKRKVGPFRETSLDAPIEAKTQPRYFESEDYVGSLARDTGFDDRDVVKMDKAQREWQFRQPVPPNLAHSYQEADNQATPQVVSYAEVEPLSGNPDKQWHYWQPRPPSEAYDYTEDHDESTTQDKTNITRPSTARPTFFKSQYESANPAYFAYGNVGLPNRSANFERVDHDVRNDRAYLDWLAKHPQPPYVPTPQGPGRPVSAMVGTRDLLREAKERVAMDRRRFQKMKREAQMKGKEYDALMMREAKEERNRKFRADIIQKEAQRQSACERQLDQTQKAKRAVSTAIRQKERSREEENQSRQKSRLQGLADKTQKRAELQAERNREIDEARAKRQELQEQRNAQRAQKHSSTLAEQREGQALREDQMRRAKLQRINRYHQKEADSQAKKDLRVAVHAQKLQEYRSRVLP